MAHALDTLRKVRAAAVDANLDEIDELLAENDDLAKQFKGMFSSIVPAGAAHTCRHKTPEKAKEHPASNKRKERSDEGRVKHPTRTKASDSRSSQLLQKSPDIREVSRDPILPLLKRRRTAASDSTPRRDCDRSGFASH